MNTETHHANVVLLLSKDPKEISLNMNCHSQYALMHAALGIASEAGELADCIKKNLAYSQDLNRENLIEELGDLEFFMEHLRQIVGIRREDTLQANMEKLSRRYPGLIYTDAAAKARADKL